MVPAGREGEPDTIIDLQSLLASEARQDEVAYVTLTKAPELLAEFNKSWRDIHSVVSKLEAEKNKAEKAAEKRKGVLILEVIPARLKELGIASAADTRQAIIATDVDYEALTDRFDQITAALVYLKGKLKSFENAYASVKKIMGEDAFNYKNKPGMSGGADSRPAPSVARPGPTAPAPASKPGWGKPKYGNG